MMNSQESSEASEGFDLARDTKFEFFVLSPAPSHFTVTQADVTSAKPLPLPVALISFVRRKKDAETGHATVRCRGGEVDLVASVRWRPGHIEVDYQSSYAQWQAKGVEHA